MRLVYKSFAVCVIAFLLIYGAVAFYAKSQHSQFQWFDLSDTHYENLIHRIRSNLMFLITSDPRYSADEKLDLATWVVLENDQITFTWRVRDPKVQEKWLMLFRQMAKGTLRDTYSKIQAHIQDDYIHSCLRSPDCQSDLQEFSHLQSE